MTAKTPTVLSLDTDGPQPLSIRAKALVFCDDASRQILDYVKMIAPSDAPVLISGETGTGKELVARHIHLLSGRTGPFLAVNCGAISENLAESELFGHEPGAFTGAVGRRAGWFEAAAGGTLFLDEIGDLPLSIQVKLLRVIQEREVVRLGSNKAIAVDVRLITGSHIDLEQSVSAGHFRQDLLYRINIARVQLPALRERRGDILPLATHFIQVYASRLRRPVAHFTQAAETELLSFHWPGNIRELENVIHFALLVAPGAEIDREHLRLGTDRLAAEAASDTTGTPKADSSASPAAEADEWQIIAVQIRQLVQRRESELLAKLEGLLVREAYLFCNSNQVQTAQALAVTRNVVRTLLKRHALIAQVDSQGASEKLPAVPALR